MNCSNPDEMIPYFKDKYFKEHEVETLFTGSGINRFMLKRPETWNYGFYLTTADNLIALNGDIYSLYIEPGYGRDGLKFLVSSINDWDYLLTKVPNEFKRALKVFSVDEAKKRIKEYFENDYFSEDIYEKLIDAAEEVDGYGERSKEFLFYERYYDLTGDCEPLSPMVVSPQTLVQLAGLSAFVDRLMGER